MKKTRIILLVIVFLTILLSYYAFAYNLPKWFPFNNKNALKEWQEKIFKGKVLYVVEPLQEGGFLLAQSQKTCSGLIYHIKFSPSKLPMISWKWKVRQFPKKAAAGKDQSGWIERDDYAARVYVVFPSWNFLNIQSIEYIWSEDLPVGKVLTSPYFGNIKLIVAESGKANLDQWVSEERNICEDYKKAFGRRCSRGAGAIALMTDSDNTLSTAEAQYTDIKVGYKNE